jgi:tetratricopeptide (TPR) repeat protein
MKRSIAVAYVCVLALAPTLARAQTPPAAPAAKPADASEVPTLAALKADLDAKRWAKAKTGAEAYVEANPNDAQGHLALARAFQGLKRPRLALKPAYKAIELDAKLVEAWRLTAEMSELVKNDAEAARLWQTVARLSKDHEAALRSGRAYVKVKDAKQTVVSYQLARGSKEIPAADLKAPARPPSR